MTDPVTTPPTKSDDGRPAIAKLLFPAPPDSAETARLPSLMQREHNASRAKNSRRIVNISDVTRIRLRRRIQKIYEMSTDVVEGYGTFYYDQHGKPLPQETVDKIMHLYHNRIERRCKEVGLTVEEEEQWDPEDSNVRPDDISDSGEESEEHDSDDVKFYSDAEDESEDDYDDEENTTGKRGNDDDSNMHGDNLKGIAKLEHEIKTLRANLENDLMILQRMTSSPNRNNPYSKFEEWSAWKKNDVDQKVAALKDEIAKLKEKAGSSNKHHKGKQGAKLITSL
jgi:uncharacterized small protein (DUF1192 family)